MSEQREEIALGKRDLTLAAVVAVAKRNARVIINEPERKRITDTSKELKDDIESALDWCKDETSRSGLELKQRMMYGTTTGFGELKTQLIQNHNDAKELQENIILSHAAGVGPLFDHETARAIMLVRANTLASGYCGVSVEIVDQLLAMIENDVWPSIPEQGSVGASGDLAPLAHLGLGLIGKGEVWLSGNGPFANLAELIKQNPEVKGLSEKLELSYKEGLSLVNGLSVMTALGALVHADAVNLVEWADVIGAVTFESLLGGSRAFDELVFKVYGHEGAKTTASRMRKMIQGSELINRC